MMNNELMLTNVIANAEALALASKHPTKVYRIIFGDGGFSVFWKMTLPKELNFYVGMVHESHWMVEFGQANVDDLVEGVFRDFDMPNEPKAIFIDVPEELGPSDVFFFLTSQAAMISTEHGCASWNEAREKLLSLSADPNSDYTQVTQKEFEEFHARRLTIDREKDYLVELRQVARGEKTNREARVSVSDSLFATMRERATNEREALVFTLLSFVKGISVEALATAARVVLSSEEEKEGK